MPCFQYKLKSNDDVPWLPKEGIEMWSWKNDGCPNLPTGMPKRLPMTEMSMLGDVCKGLEKHLSFFELIQRRSATRELKEPWERLIIYWKAIINTLEKEVVEYRPEDGPTLVQGFWPRTNWKENVPMIFRNVACELEAQESYVGAQKDKPLQSFDPRIDVGKGDFILQRPDTNDLKTYPVHMGQVVSDVREGGLNVEKKVQHVCDVAWFRPIMSDTRIWSPKERWSNCWIKKWEVDPNQQVSIEPISSILWSFKGRKGAKSITIGKANANKAQDNLERCTQREGCAIKEETINNLFIV